MNNKFNLKYFGVIGGEAQGDLSVRKFCYLIPNNQTIEDVKQDNYFISEKNRLILNDLIEVLSIDNNKEIQYHLLKVIEISLSSVKVIELNFNSFHYLKSGKAIELIKDGFYEIINVLFDNKTIKVNNDNQLYLDTKEIVDNENIKSNEENKVYLDIENLIDNETIKKNENNKIYSIGGGGNAKHQEISWEDYQQLEERGEIDPTTEYFIYDIGESPTPSTTITKATEEEIREARDSNSYINPKQLNLASLKYDSLKTYNINDNSIYEGNLYRSKQNNNRNNIPLNNEEWWELIKTNIIQLEQQDIENLF